MSCPEVRLSRGFLQYQTTVWLGGIGQRCWSSVRSAPSPRHRSSNGQSEYRELIIPIEQIDTGFGVSDRMRGK